MHIEVIARGVLIRGGKVLLCRNIKHGYLYLPGGHVEFGESARAAAAREFLEETGARVQVGNLVMVSEGAFGTRKRAHHEVNLLFHVEQQGGGAKAARISSREAHLAFEWVELAAAADLDIRPVAAKAFLAAGAAPAQGVEWVSEIG